MTHWPPVVVLVVKRNIQVRRIHHTNPCLNTIPDTCHCRPVKYRPEPAPDPERSTTGDWKSNVISGTNTSCCHNECTCNGVANPDADPRLPPRQTGNDTGGCNHPCVDVEGIGYPEADIIPGPPLPSGRFNWRGSSDCASNMKHVRLLPGFRSSFASIVCVLLNPSSVSTEIRFRTALPDGSCIFGDILTFEFVSIVCCNCSRSD